MKRVEKRVRPFLKWAGGKSRLVNELMTYLPPEYGKYYEPFLGAGSMYFAISPQEGRLNDLNKHLIACYQDVKMNCEPLIAELTTIQQEYRSRVDIERKKDYYLEKRDEYNVTDQNVRKSALFIFLNKTGFNGMYRENRQGKFNIPFGRHANPLICDEDNLRNVSQDLEHIDLTSLDYKDALDGVEEGDFIFLDPPYEPLSKTSKFTQYQANGFGQRDQEELKKLILWLSAKGCYVMMTNSTADLIKELYRDTKQFHIGTIQVARSINSNGKKRGKIEEYIVFNYNPINGELLWA